MRLSGILLDRRSRTPLHRQLEAALRDAILSGRLRAGERILSSRELRTHFGVSRNTIVSALAQLHDEGYLVTTRGVGTFVAKTLHPHLLESRGPSAEPRIVPTERAAAFMYARPLAANLDMALPFRPGIPALDLFPSRQFRRELRPADWTSRALDYPGPLGSERLREAIVKRLQQTRGVACTPNQVLITSGAQAAFALIASVILRKSDTVVVEEPTYPNARAVFIAEGARLYPIPVDDEGITVASFSNVAARLVHVSPSHQYPTGAVLSLGRRFALLDWASRQDAWIVEDDYDSEFTYTGAPQPALHGLGEGRRVLYVGTFSKVLSPALRIGYVVVPRALCPAFAAAQQVLGGQPCTILQNALAGFIEKGHFGRHITKTRAIYDERRRFTHDGFKRLFGSQARINDSRAGLHFTVSLPEQINDAAFSKRAWKSGIILPALSRHFHGQPTLNGIIVGYAASSIPAAKSALGALESIIEEQGSHDALG